MVPSFVGDIAMVIGIALAIALAIVIIVVLARVFWCGLCFVFEILSEMMD